MMAAQQFTPAAPGRLVELGDGNSAFVPNPIPPDLVYEGPLLRQIEEANWALGQLDRIGHDLPNPQMLIRPFQRHEAVVSSRIEGIIAEPRDLTFANAGRPAKLSDEVREVRNYVDALNLGLKELEKLPVCLRLIRDVHKRLMTGARGQEQRPGEFRDIQNYIGTPGGFANARYIPPPVAQMHDRLKQFELFLHAETTVPDLVRLALVHYQFEAIHPFRDGNGRIGRLLLSLLLHDWKLLTRPLLYLSPYFDRHREEYFDLLLRISTEGAWQRWIEFFVRGIVEQARDTADRANKLLALRDDYRRRMQSAHAPALSVRLTDALFEQPAVTIPLAQRMLHISYPGAKLHVLRLVKAGILAEPPVQSHPKVYIAQGILDLTEGP